MKNNYEVRGDVTAIFVKCRGEIKECLIDTSDLSACMSEPGTFYGIKGTHTTYCSITIPGTKKSIRIHNLLIRVSESEEVDHRNHNGLDNRRVNLNAVDHSRNMINRSGSNKNSSSGYRGVYFVSSRNQWKSEAMLLGKSYSAGYHDSPEEANKWATRMREFLFEGGPRPNHPKRKPGPKPGSPRRRANGS